MTEATSLLVAAVKFKWQKDDKTYDYFIPADLTVNVGDRVFVPTAKGETKVEIVALKDASDKAEKLILRAVEDLRTDEEKAAKYPNGQRKYSEDRTMSMKTAIGRSSTTSIDRSPTMNAYVPALAGGGSVIAIVPQTFEETMRVSRAVVASGLAPAALVGKLTGDDAAAAVAVAIMSGAELGLKPMVSLRSFTVINGKPALYGDGLINVVRMSGRVAYLRTGCDEIGGKLVGYCEAKRSDTGEEKRVEFSQDDATRARLWDERATVRKQVWENGGKVWKDGQPNDAPWYRFPKRMLAWRAAGYCLRELFGDVLGGIRDEFEAREIADAESMRDVTPSEEASKPTPPKPPKPPAPPSAKTIDAEPAKPDQTTEGDFDLGGYLEEIETALAGAPDETSVEEIWNDFDAPAVLETEGHADLIEAAFSIKTRRLAQLSPLNGG